jgi:U3 small nucleolar RNA-associated protein 12
MEIWTVDLDREKRLLFTGSGEGELKVWQIDLEALQDGIKESADGEVCIKKNKIDSQRLLTQRTAGQIHYTPVSAATVHPSSSITNHFPSDSAIRCRAVT